MGVIGVGIGAVLTGLVSVTQIHLQRKIQIEALVHQARVQQEAEQRRFEAERWAWHAELRRRSYIDCLISVEKCSNFFEYSEKASESLIPEEGSIPEPWTNSLSPEDFIEKFNQQMANETFDRVQVVRLDGPENVSQHARKLLNSLLNYWIASQAIASDRAASRPHSREDHDNFLAIFKEFRDDITEFITMASASLSRPARSVDNGFDDK